MDGTDPGIVRAAREAKQGDTASARETIRMLTALLEALGEHCQDLIPLLEQMGERDPVAQEIYEALRPFRGEVVQHLADHLVPGLRRLAAGAESDANKALYLWRRQRSGSDPGLTKNRDWTIALEIGMRRELLKETLSVACEKVAQRRKSEFRRNVRRGHDYPVDAVRAAWKKHGKRVEERLEHDRILRDAALVPSHREEIAQETEREYQQRQRSKAHSGCLAPQCRRR